MPSPKILVADDSRTVQCTLKRILSPAGYQLLFASDGREAVDMATLGHPDLAILDILMPEMDGYAACDEILKQSVIPIVFLTREPGPQLSELGRQLGAYLPKPVDEESLLLTVADLLNCRDSCLSK
ncbi:MAG: response regulator [Planctomycetota bacterium]